MTSELYVFLNGRIVPQSRAALSVFDFGYLYGYGLFETVRCYDGTPFRMERHLRLLDEGARALKLPCPSTLFDLSAAAQQTLAANHLGDARVRVTVSLQGETALPRFPSEPRLTVLLTALPFTPLAAEKYSQGYKAIVSSMRRNSRSPVARLKTVNYLENFLAREEARQAGVDEAILLNERGEVSSASSANIFVFSKGELVTPPVESGSRPGVTREVVLELASGPLALPTSLRPITLRNLLQADEAFLTSSMLGVMPLVQVNGQTMGEGTLGLLTKRVMSAYAELVAQETRRSFS